MESDTRLRLSEIAQDTRAHGDGLLRWKVMRMFRKSLMCSPLPPRLTSICCLQLPGNLTQRCLSDQLSGSLQRGFRGTAAHLLPFTHTGPASSVIISQEVCIHNQCGLLTRIRVAVTGGEDGPPSVGATVTATVQAQVSVKTRVLPSPCPSGCSEDAGA